MQFLSVICSNLGSIFYRLRHKASFRLKTHIFLPLHLIPNLKMLPLQNIAQILRAKSHDSGLIIRV